MKTIYKYSFNIKDEQLLELPATADPVHVGLDPQGQPCLWAVIDTDLKTETRKLYVRGTGHWIPEDYKTMLGSFTQGPFVWHVFLN